MSAPPRLLLGLDPGEATGYALAAEGALVAVCALPVLDALGRLEADAPRLAAVVIEDARALPIYARHGALRGGARDRLARGVGHVDAYTALLVERAARLGLPVARVEPSRAPKWTADDLARLTGWAAPTNEHARDAARLVFGLHVAQAVALADGGSASGVAQQAPRAATEA